MSTRAFGDMRLSRSAPIFRAPVPPTAWTVAILPSRTAGESAPKTSACVAASYAAMPSIGR